MNRKRLKELIKVLRGAQKAEDAGKRKFDMSSWFSILIGNEPTFEVKGPGCDDLSISKTSCRTSACALGSAALHPPFQRAGLKIVPRSSYRKIVTLGPGDYAYMDVRYKGNRGIKAGTSFFGISGNDAAYLFVPDRYDRDEDDIRPADVIKRVQELLGR